MILPGQLRREFSQCETPADLFARLESLDRAIRVRDQAMAIVAHDLRNPMEVIAASASVLMNTLHEPEVRRHLERIVHVTQRAATLVNYLVDVVNIEAGTLSVLKRRVDLASTIRATVESQATLAEGRDVAISLELPAELARLDADPERLAEVLENLLGNALKFTGPSGTISVGAKRQGTDVLVWVKDTGCGIAEADVRHLFDGISHERPCRRTRLGLRICKTIVETHAGRIWVDSALGRGTTVFFTLPAVADE